MKIEMETIIQFGMVVVLRYKYRVESGLWEDPTSLKAVSFGNSINRLSDSSSKIFKHYSPLVIE